MIRTFKDKETKAVFAREFVKRFSGIEQSAYTRLGRLDAAAALTDLAAIPGNRLEALSADRKGQHSIRINDQWRICFRWIEGKGPHDVEIVDYH
jgi:proteic killer suppression protein